MSEKMLVTQALDEKPLSVVDAYVKENTTELVDPLDVKKKMEVLEEKTDIEIGILF